MRTGVITLVLVALSGPAAAQLPDDAARAAAQRLDPSLAKVHFGRVDTPTAPPVQAIGSYARGCLAGAAQLAADGPGFQAMRLERNRRWGHPDHNAFVESLGEAAQDLGLRGLLVGDLSQPRGGPMLYGHTSHQNGLDVDIWLTEMPAKTLTAAEREAMPLVSVLGSGQQDVDPARFTPAFAGLIRAAAEDARVERIFVHPLIKRAMCRATWPSRTFLRKVRPWYGHDAHFHIRLRCPGGSPACVAQRPTPRGDGCGDALDYWFSPAPYAADARGSPRQPLTVARLPAACQRLLGAPSPATGEAQ